MPNWFENHASDPNNLSRQFSSSSWGKVSGKVLGNAQQNNREITEFLIQFLFGSCLEWTCVSQLKAWRRMLSASFLHGPFAPINADDVSELSSSSLGGLSIIFALTWSARVWQGSFQSRNCSCFGQAVVRVTETSYTTGRFNFRTVHCLCRNMCKCIQILHYIQKDSFNTRMYVKQISLMSTNDIGNIKYQSVFCC